MTKDEHAKEIIEMFAKVVSDRQYLSKKAAKACAVIHVNGIIKFLPQNVSGIGYNYEDAREYWQEILSILQKQ